MEAILKNGDYVENGRGGIWEARGENALLQRALFKLQARRGMFPLLPALGSRLYTLPRMKKSERDAAARQFASEALLGEPVDVTDITISESGEGQIEVCAFLALKDSGLSASIILNL